VTRRPLEQCPKCGCAELFIRKDFPQKLGLSAVLLAGIAFLWLAASRQRFYLGAIVLVAAAVLDGLLYIFVPKITVCYRCRAEFRGVPLNPGHTGFELAVAEKYRAAK
jgi:drug/metabolite transporter (DMT)-like permease